MFLPSFKTASITGLFLMQEDTDTVGRCITSKRSECFSPAEHPASLRLAASSAAQGAWMSEQFLSVQ